MSLALTTLIYEWRRYLAAMFALAFSGVLILAQVGMFLGVGKAFTAFIDRSRADIIVLSATATDLDSGTGIPKRLIPEMYLTPEVAEVQDLQIGGGRFQNYPKPGETPKGDFVQLWALDTRPDAVSLPVDFTESMRQALEEPYAVAIDQSSLAKLGVKKGDVATLNGRTIKVKLILKNYPNLFNAQIMGSRTTLQLLGQAPNGPMTGPLLVRLRNSSQTEAVKAELNAKAKGRYRAWTKPELSRANTMLAFRQQAVGVMLGFSLFLAILIGIGITWQTLRAAIFANIREFASLRALGVSVGALRGVVMELSFWVGVASLAVTGLLMLGVIRLAVASSVILSFNLISVVLVGLFLMIVAVLSGALSLGVLRHSDPAELLR